MKLFGLAKKIFLPEVEVNYQEKKVMIKGENFFGENLTDAYYTLKGYDVVREEE